MLSEEKLNNLLNNKLNVTVLESVGSTNTELKKLAQNGATDGTVLIAKKQTAGRGRLGRSFYSPENSGIYMSVLFRPNIDFKDASLITPATSVSVLRALKNSGAKNLGIKWVNDIFCENKKTAGILTEISFTSSSQIDFLIVGIGINLTTEVFPTELENIAGSVFKDKPCDKNKIVADTLNSLYDFYKNIKDRTFLQDYKNYSILTGRDVFLVYPDKKIPVTVLGIDDDCRLIVRYSDGSSEHISTGEISVRF